MDLEEFEEMLDEAGIDISLYGKGEAKSLEQFFQEVSNPNEASSLLPEGEKLIRVVNLVNIHVFHHYKSELLRLREIIQVFNDCRVRFRLNRQAAVSEKCHSNEDIMETVLRSLREELGIHSEDLNEVDNMFQVSMSKIRNYSQSYPGIESEYRIVYFMYIMSEDNFRPEGYVEVQNDKKTYFVWEKM